MLYELRDHHSTSARDRCRCNQLQNAQGKGIGRQLTVAVARALMARNFTTMLVWVLAENPACKFYEALGGQAVTEKTETIDGKALREIGYGWQNITPLMTP